METTTSRVKEVFVWLIEHKYISSQKQLAEQIGFAPTTISNILAGRAVVSAKFARALKMFSNGQIDSDWILTGKGNMLISENNPSIRRDLEQIIAERNIVEYRIRRQLQQFYEITGFAIDDIKCSHSTDQDGNIVFDVRIPLTIPSDGVASREPRQEHKQINPVTQKAYELIENFTQTIE